MPAHRLYREEVRRFENCEYALKEFSHREHLKVAWTYLQLFGYQAALEVYQTIIQNAVDDAVYQKKSAQQALDDAAKNIQRAMRR